MMNILIAKSIVLALGVLAIPSFVSPQSTESLKLKSTVTAPKIDGVIEADEWRSAVRVDLNYQAFPGQDETPASEKTTAWIFYDREHLYIAFHAFDSEPTTIRAPVSKRDNIDADDYVTVFLDTYYDKQRAYYISVSAKGVQQDGIFTEGGGPDVTWDGIYHGAAKIVEDGYVVEIAIPFKTLRFKAGKDALWGIHLRRWIARKSERTSWKPLYRNQSSFLAQAGSVGGLDNVFSGPTIDIIPTLTGSRTGTREADPVVPFGAKLHDVNRLDPGLTVIYSITPNATLSATINPDFSQVEADVPQISVNQRFPLSFPEKRPFFLEGSEFFRTTSAGTFRLLDTRQIVDPDWGVKFSGKFGRNTFSYLAASERSAGLRVDPNNENFGKNALFNVFRYQRDILKDSAVGVFLTDRRFAGSSNTVAAAEGRIRLDKVNTINAQFAFSNTKPVNGPAKQAYAHNIRFTHFSRSWHIYLSDELVQPDFNAFAGFVVRKDYHRYSIDVGYEWRPKENSSTSKWLVYVWPYIIYSRSRTLKGKPEISFTDPAVEIVLKRNIQINYWYSFGEEGFAGAVFRPQYQNVSWSANGFNKVTFSGNFRWGEGIRFDPLNPALGDLFQTRQSVTLRPLAKLNTEFLYLKSRLSRKNAGENYFNQDIIRNRTIFQFNQYNAVRSIVDYDTSTRRIGISLLYGYTPRPNTAFYVGYGDELYNGYDPLFDRRTSGLIRQTRSLFAKFSYNWRF
jgi:hypothetical protein